MNGTIFCNKCGAPNATGSQFCSRCGTAMGGVPAPAPVAAQPPVPYAAPVPQASVAYGGFWIRVVASIVDAIIVRVIVTPLGLMFGGMSVIGGLGGLSHTGFALFGGGTMVVVVLCAQWIYEAALESSSYQATLGKLIFGMKVTDLYGNRISFARATGRHFAKILSAFILFIGFIMVGFTERKQGLHDMMAGTLVRRF